MMQKILSILFVAFYFTISVVYTVQVHYCGGELQSIELFSENISCCCGETSAKTMNNCCKNYQIDVDHPENQLPVVSDYKISLPEIDLPQSITVEPVIDTQEALEEKIPPPPPKFPKEPARVLYHSFLYYG